MDGFRKRHWFYNGFHNGFHQNAGITTVSTAVSGQTWVWKACASHRAWISIIRRTQWFRGAVLCLRSGVQPWVPLTESGTNPWALENTRNRVRRGSKHATPRSRTAAASETLAPVIRRLGPGGKRPPSDASAREWCERFANKVQSFVQSVSRKCRTLNPQNN